MDKEYAVIEDGIVSNIILAPSKEVAEFVTKKTCVEYTKENPAHIELGYVDGVFEQPAPTNQANVVLTTTPPPGFTPTIEEN